MRKLLMVWLCLGALASGQYKVEPAGEAPGELAAAIKAELQPAGHKILKPDGSVWCEVWLRKSAPEGPETTEVDVTWKKATPGAVVGAIRFPNGGEDRRAQPLKPGVYTLRFSMFPINGDHQGVAPQRDFLVLTPVSVDQSLDTVPKFDDLMKMSRNASGTPHPAVLSMWYVDSDYQPGLQQIGEHDWVLFTEVGGAKIALILVGKAEG
jgi:hypothetical protein